jgi:hypothetical protein
MSPPARRPRRAGRHERRRSPAQDDLPRSAGSLIAAALAARGLTDEIRARDVVLNWHTIVGPRIAARTQPDSLSQRVLYVRVASSAWMHELTLLRPQLLATIQAAMGTPRLVDELRLHLGARATSGPDPVREAARARALPRPAPTPTPATGARADAIEAETSAIADDELRELVRKVRLRNDR